jgi:DHA1 family tetracycline resistance protein-like MFS transporter
MFKNKALVVLFFTLLLDTISVGILIPILPIIFTDPSSPAFILHGYTQGQQYFIAGAITGVFGFMQFFAAPLLGELSDVYGRKRFLTMSVAVLALSNLLFGFGIQIASLTVLIISRVTAGIAGANFSIAQASIADVSEPHVRAKNFGIISAAFGIGFILGPFLGGIISETFNHPATPFWFAGILGMLNVIFISTFLPETRVVSEKKTESFNIFKGLHNIRAAFRDKDAAPVYMANFLYTSGFAFFTTFVSILLTVRFAFTEGTIGIYFSVVGAFIVLTQLGLVGYFTDRFTEKTLMLYCIPLVALSIFIYPYARNIEILYVLIPLMAIPQGITFASVSALISKSVSAEKQGAALGINGSLMALAQGIIPLLAGIGSGVIGLTAPFIAGGIFILASWYVIYTSKHVKG